MNGRFVLACTKLSDLPSGGEHGELIEVAVAGRSNCGKSTLINALVGHNKLARTSSTPGRTRQLMFFAVRLPGAPWFHLVDLPGYGYAKVSRKEARGWAPLIEGYIERREQLKVILLLLDSRRKPGDEERDLLRWCGERGLVPLVVLTKADKLNKSQRFAAAEAAKKGLKLGRRPLCVSSREQSTVDQLRDRLVSMIRRASAGPVVGLTGGIAAGKSLVAGMLAELGACVVDADALAREVVAPGSEGLAKIVERFGEQVLGEDGALDRARLGERVFNDDQARAALEAITHPAIVALSEQRISQAQGQGAPLVVYEAALLVETGRHERLEGPLVVVVADAAVRVQRIVERDGLDQAAAQQRLASQLPQQRKRELADHVIDNSGTIEQTRAQVLDLYAALVRRP